MISLVRRPASGMHPLFRPHIRPASHNRDRKAMAYLETSFVIVKTFWHFNFEKAEGALGEVGAGSNRNAYGRHSPEEFQLFEMIWSTHDGPNFVFHSTVE
ncbi:hypothetical protein GGR53DRAFT_516389 [Hypoxylon sp. FL1150]|nr:hypothetical protein GGR53DRAFT_516389 [Hypoxylon sp. FL1150]